MCDLLPLQFLLAFLLRVFCSWVALARTLVKIHKSQWHEIAYISWETTSCLPSDIPCSQWRVWVRRVYWLCRAAELPDAIATESLWLLLNYLMPQQQNHCDCCWIAWYHSNRIIVAGAELANATATESLWLLLNYLMPQPQNNCGCGISWRVVSCHTKV